MQKFKSDGMKVRNDPETKSEMVSEMNLDRNTGTKDM